MPASGIKRIRGACSTCRHRKVRCDAAILDSPCTNCRRNGLFCDTVRLPKDKKPTSSADTSITADITGHLTAIQASKNRGRYQPFTNFGFFATPKLQNLCSEDMICLRMQKSLYVPERPVLESFLRHYFLYVHPCMPVVDEARFWEIYHGDDESSSPTQEFSLLLFQAMLFAASSYIPIELAKSFGYDSIVAARNSLYRSAKALYDFDTEDSSLSIAQAALLLTYHNSSVNQLTNSTWLSIAIQHARASNAHLYDTQNQTHHQISLLKRIWWSCIVRDRIIAIGMRRPLQITQHDFDFSKPGIQHADFEDENPISEVYSQLVKEQLCDVFVAQCQLAVAMTSPMSVLYPAIRRKATNSHADISNQLTSCVEGLSHLKTWELGYLMPLKDRQVNVHATVKLFAHLTSLYYQSTRVALCHHMALLLFIREEARWHQSQVMSIHQIKEELIDAIGAVTATVRDFFTVCNVSSGHLPLSVLMNIILPAFLLRLDIQLSPSAPSLGNVHSSPSPKLPRDSKHSLNFYLQIIQICNTRYDTSYIADWFEQLIRMATAVKMRMLSAHTRSPKQLPSFPESFLDFLEYQPIAYLRLAATIDNLFAAANVSLATTQRLSALQRGMVPQSGIICASSTNHSRHDLVTSLNKQCDDNSDYPTTLEACDDFTSGQQTDYMYLINSLPLLGG